jgi:uncharacterized protein (TIGR02231 family)
MFRTSFTFTLILTSFLFCSCILYSQPSEYRSPVMSSKILSVTLYPDMALIRRAVQVELRKGENTVVLEGLTPEIIDASVQVDVEVGSAAEVNVLDVKVWETFLSAFKQREEIEKIKQRLEEVDREILLRGAEKEGVKIFISNVEKFSSSAKERIASINVVSSYFELIEKILMKSERRLAEIEDNLKKLNDEKNKLENELKVYGDKKEKTKSIEFLVYSRKDSVSTLRVSYLVRRAGWKPSYDIRADTVLNRCSIEYLAMIFQSTGEDWEDVGISVSTQKPSLFREIPELSPWYVDKLEVIPFVKKERKGAFMALQEGAAADVVVGEGEKEGFLPYPAQAQVVQELAAVSFTLPRGIKIPSDDKLHRVVLATAYRDVKISYVTVPRIAPYVYLKTAFENPFSYPMLSGDAKIYVDNKFVGKIFFEKTLYPGESKDVPLGVDESIKVERKLVRKFTEYGGIGVFATEKTIHYEYTVEISNGKPKDIELEFNDNLPISKNEKIRVEIKEPRDKNLIKEDGRYTLFLKLKPKEVYKHKVAFSVSFPKNWEVIGIE